MSEPRRNSRKGRMLDIRRLMGGSIASEWLPYRGDWQPGTKLRERTREWIQDMRKALDDLEAKL